MLLLLYVCILLFCRVHITLTNTHHVSTTFLTPPSSTIARLSEAAAQARAAAQTANLPNVAHVPGLQTNLPFRSIPKLDGAPIPDGPPRIHIPTGRASRKVDKDLDAGNILLALSKGPGASDDEEEDEEGPTAAKKQPEEDASKKRKVEEEEDGPPRERKKPKIKTECFVKGCSNWSIHHGVCWLHWAQQGPVDDIDIIVAKKTNSNAKVCSNEEYTNQVVAQGVCIKHGAMAKICSKEGCDNQAVSAGVCVKHGGKRKKLCKVQGCVNQTVKDGVCVRHGAKKHKVCEREGCTSLAKKGGVCIKHGAVVKRCKAEGCNNNALKGGVCVRVSRQGELSLFTLLFIIMNRILTLIAFPSSMVPLVSNVVLQGAKIELLGEECVRGMGRRIISVDLRVVSTKLRRVVVV